MKKYLTFDDVQILPRYSEVPSRSHCDVSSHLTNKIEVGLPIISAPMDTVTEAKMAYTLSQYGAVGCLHRFTNPQEQLKMFQDVYSMKSDFLEDDPIHVCPSIGVTGDYLERLELLSNDPRLEVICLDVAHGDHILVKQAIKKIKSEYPNLEIIAGNIATEDAAMRLIEWGADSLRVGIGGGSLCETRIRTGVGVPMVTCLLDVCAIANEYDIPVIADGGIRTPGDVAKALACGASMVMLGSLLAGTKESPGAVLGEGNWPNERKYKSYRGSASSEAKSARGESGHVEGNSAKIPYKGKVGRIIKDIEDGIRSAFSYTGSWDIHDFHTNAELIEITSAGAMEAKPHLLG